MKSLDDLLKIGVLSVGLIAAANGAMAQSKPTTVVYQNGTVKTLQETEQSENAKRIKRAYELKAAAEANLANNEYSSAVFHITNAFFSYPGKNEPKPFKDLLVKTYKLRLNEMTSQNGGFFTEDTDNLLFEIPRYVSDIKDAKLLALMACRTTSMKDRKNYYAKSMRLNNKDAVSEYELRLGNDWKEKLGI